MKPKVIKRYQNRKLYDTSQSRDITLEDLAKMIRRGDEVMVVDNKTQKDITSNTLTQLIFETEKKTKGLLPVHMLYDIIKMSGGSISHFFQHTIKTGAREIANVRGEIQKRIENVTGIAHLHKEIEQLKQRVQELQEKLKKYE